MHQHPSDLSWEEYNLIREDLEGAKKTQPGKYDWHDVFCAMLYAVQGGIQWRMLPSDYLKWQSVYYHFRVGSEKDEMGISILDKVLQKLEKQIRSKDLRRDKTTFGIVDAQSVQNADTGEETGYDAGKHIWYPLSAGERTSRISYSVIVRATITTWSPLVLQHCNDYCSTDAGT